MQTTLHLRVQVANVMSVGKRLTEQHNLWNEFIGMQAVVTSATVLSSNP